MKRLRLLVLLLLAPLAFQVAHAWDHTYRSGRLVDVTTADRLKKGTTSTRAIFTVQVADMVYTLRGEKVGANAKDYAEGMVVGDTVQASVEGEHVYLRTPKGRQLKTDILKRARATAP